MDNIFQFVCQLSRYEKAILTFTSSSKLEIYRIQLIQYSLLFENTNLYRKYWSFFESDYAPSSYNDLQIGSNSDQRCALNNNIAMRNESIDSSDSENSFERDRQYQKIYAKQIKKRQALELKRTEKQRQNGSLLAPSKQQISQLSRTQEPPMTLNLSKSLHTNNIEVIYQKPAQLKWHIYPNSPPIDIKSRVPFPMSQLPIFRKKDEILQAIMMNQFILVTGQTGCGKSTQVPRLIYEYLRQIKDQDGKIMCVQPRRLAVMNLQSILQKQMKEAGLIGYQIGMKSFIKPENKIVFVTNGIFLQRLVHGTEFFEEYPFIILDQVHERDIDTDFILLTIKRVIRKYPKVRIILMSATIDNDLFRYYFASDHIDNILKEQNFYKKIIRSKFQTKQMENDQNDGEDSDEAKENKLYQANSYSFMKSKHPCPTINVTQPGKFTRTFYYLDTLDKFLPKDVTSNRWGSIIFSDKYPNTHRQLYQSVCLIIEEISRRDRRKQSKASVLIFMPGLGQIQNLSQNIVQFFKTERIKNEYEIIHVHSSILNDQITQQLHRPTGKKHRIIIATNIAESSITVPGIQYVIDFCLSKEIRFDLKSRMQNLQLVWAGKASCNQRAGRTGRVCDGTIIRLVQTNFYEKFPDYSTPQMQRSSLDKLILRIKLLHQSEKDGHKIFEDPGQVLGSAIQPPHLKNIDTAINSLHYCGGLQFKDDQFKLTNLGRLYIEIPIDITYCKMLITSQLFDTFDDMVVLVAILSQSKNAIRRGSIQKNYMNYYNIIDNPQNCDFQALIRLYRSTRPKERYENGGNRYSNYQNRDQISLQVYSEVKEMIRDITRRMQKKEVLYIRNERTEQYCKLIKSLFRGNQNEQYSFRFKLSLTCGFLQNLLKIKEPSLDDKQEKRIKHMKRQGIEHKNTICVLGSTLLRKPQTSEAEEKLKKHWIGHIHRTSYLNNQIDITLTYGLSYIHFQSEKDLQKFLFVRYIEQNKKTFTDDKYQSSDKKNYLSINQVLKCLGEIDHMHAGRPVTFSKQQTVIVDNFSLNRIVNLNQGAHRKFLISNNIAKQSSRMVARYTSLLPTHIKYFQIIVHLLFYPFVSVLPNKQKTRYEYLQIKKKQKIPITYNLTDEEISKANEVRKLFRDYLSLEPKTQSSQNFKYFLELTMQLVFIQRKELVEQQRWQQVFLKQLFEKQQNLKESFQQVKLSQMDVQIPIMDVESKDFEKLFMNQIKPVKLRSHFFSNLNIAGLPLQQRLIIYNEWKQQKLIQNKAIERKALDKDSYLACGQDSCGLKIAKMMKIGPISREMYRDLFSYEKQNVKQIAFDQQDCHFCALILSNYIDCEFKTYGCARGHYFGIEIQGQKNLKILPFSQLMVIYPDGSAEKANFQRLDVKNWKRKHDQKLLQRYKITISTYCFICDETIKTFKDLEYHIKESQHGSNVREFSKSIPDEMRGVKDKNEQTTY